MNTLFPSQPHRGIDRGDVCLYLYRSPISPISSMSSSRSPKAIHNSTTHHHHCLTIDWLIFSKIHFFWLSITTSTHTHTTINDWSIEKKKSRSWSHICVCVCNALGSKVEEKEWHELHFVIFPLNNKSLSFFLSLIVHHQLLTHPISSSSSSSSQRKKEKNIFFESFSMEQRESGWDSPQKFIIIGWLYWEAPLGIKGDMTHGVLLESVYVSNQCFRIDRKDPQFCVYLALVWVFKKRKNESIIMPS